MNGLVLDNGQHIMIGAYTEVLRLMRLVGADSATPVVAHATGPARCLTAWVCG